MATVGKSDETTLVVSQPTVSVADAVTPKNVTLRFAGNGKITVAAGKVLRVNGAIDAAPNAFIFDVSAAKSAVKLFDSPTATVFPEWFGAKHDGNFNDAPALQKTFDSLTPYDGTTLSRKGKTVQLARGRYFCAQTLTINAVLRVVGQGGHSSGGWDDSYNSTVLQFAPNTTGLILEIYHPTNEFRADSGGAYLADFALDGSKKDNQPNPNVNGIYVEHGAVMERVSVTRFAGSGIVLAGTGNKGENSNLSSLSNCKTYGNSLHGLAMIGVNSNASLISLHDSGYNGGAGYYSDNQLGNTFIACHSVANGQGAWREGGSGVSNNTLIGCYSEAGEPPSNLSPRSLVLGGVISSGDTSGFAANSRHGAITTNNGTLLFRAGSDIADGSTVMGFSAAGGDHSPILEFYKHAYLKAGGQPITVYQSNLEIVQGNLTAGISQPNAQHRLFGTTTTDAVKIGESGTALHRVLVGKIKLQNGSATFNINRPTPAAMVFLNGQDDNVKGALRSSLNPKTGAYTVTSSVGTDNGTVAFQYVEP